MNHRFSLAAATTAIALAFAPGMARAAQVENVVLVHGMNADGGIWRDVHHRLTTDGYDVTVVQLPLTSIEADLAATRRAIEAQDGPMILVGHSYGGVVISETGTDPDVAALVYVTAFQPEPGESVAELQASVLPKMPADSIKVFEDGYYLVKPEAWIKFVANGVPESDASYTAHFQASGNTAIFGHELENAAWQDKPSFAFIGTQDMVIAPELQHQMANRAGSTITEVEVGHLPTFTHANEIAAFIESAAASIK